ncbi:MAG TPA: HAD-IIB family hydrolase [Casimicrobiaceae bacterium]|nr:HAD-IIB family hydrolase [Casimicrobiaceae bacterium]
MRPLCALPDAVRGAIRGVLCDIDDTLSTAGRITAEAYAAMERLRSAGRLVVPVTGRPAGWCNHIARMWPVDAVVGENGALYMLHDDRRRKLRVCHALGADERTANRERLERIAARILRKVPGCAIASDQAYRDSDLAIDYCEDVVPLPVESVERIAALMRSEGMSARVSSIHVNGWFGNHDKLSMTRRLFAEEFGIDLDAERGRFVFVGDSPNDAPMFEFFPHSVGVANVRKFAGRIATPPKYVTTREAGAGFAELATALSPAATW